MTCPGDDVVAGANTFACWQEDAAERTQTWKRRWSLRLADSLGVTVAKMTSSHDSTRGQLDMLTRCPQLPRSRQRIRCEVDETTSAFFTTVFSLAVAFSRFEAEDRSRGCPSHRLATCSRASASAGAVDGLW
jgi:hypothetical protein